MPRTELRSGFSFLEILAATIFLMVCLTFLYSTLSSSQRGTADSYRETIAYTLAGEAVEWVAGLGYERLCEIARTPGNVVESRLGLGSFRPVAAVAYDDGSTATYPEDYTPFERKVEVIPDVAARLVLVRVTVQAREFGFIRRHGIVLERIVGADY
ncbi:MAG TPA: hypothetical protein VIV61_08970 [Candidatus Ozemobacteraceae bacterium]